MADPPKPDSPVDSPPADDQGPPTDSFNRKMLDFFSTMPPPAGSTTSEPLAPLGPPLPAIDPAAADLAPASTHEKKVAPLPSVTAPQERRSRLGFVVAMLLVTAVLAVAAGWFLKHR